jgi:hypothetical protein
LARTAFPRGTFVLFFVQDLISNQDSFSAANDAFKQRIEAPEAVLQNIFALCTTTILNSVALEDTFSGV